jgi:hypothetical protein
VLPRLVVLSVATKWQCLQHGTHFPFGAGSLCFTCFPSVTVARLFQPHDDFVYTNSATLLKPALLTVGIRTCNKHQWRLVKSTLLASHKQIAILYLPQISKDKPVNVKPVSRHKLWNYSNIGPVSLLIYTTLRHLFCGMDPAADAMGAPQPWGLLCNSVMQVCSFFRVTEHRWNEIDGRKPRCSGKNLSQCHFVRHISHMDWPGIAPGPPRWEAGG